MDADRERRVEELFAEYVDRLNGGESIDPETVLAENPLFGSEVLSYLDEYLGAASGEDDALSLGTIGDFTLRRELGRGGMGIVYEAWEGSMGRRVALKVLPAGVAVREKAFHRFLREARTAGMLTHPGVVPVFGVGIRERTPFYAMLTGQSRHTSFRS